MGGFSRWEQEELSDGAAWSEFQPSISRVCGWLTNPDQRRPGLSYVDSFLLLLTAARQNEFYVLLLLLTVPGVLSNASLRLMSHRPVTKAPF